MLSLLNGLRSDHPLHSKKARVELLDELKRMSPLPALGELAAYLDAIKTAENLSPARALDIIEFVQNTATPLQDQLTSQFISRPRATKFEQDRVHSGMHFYCGQLMEAYRFCLGKYQVSAIGVSHLKPHLAKIIACALDACATQIKWTLFRHGTLSQRFWREIAELYHLALSLSLAQTSYTRTGRAESTPECSFAAALMLPVSAPDALLPAQIELASRLIHRLRAEFRVSLHPESYNFQFDLSRQDPPGRAREDQEPAANVLYFGPGSAVVKIDEMIQSVERTASVPSWLGSNGHMSATLVQATLRHLLRYWSSESPRRRAPRRRVTEYVTVVHQFDEVAAGVGGLFLESPYVSNEEQWILENEGANGFGACVPAPNGFWLTVGSLIGLRRAEGSSWGAGVVRRIASGATGERYVGIEMLSHGGAAVTIIAAGLSARHSRLPAQGELCVLLSAGSAHSGEATLLMRPGLFSSIEDVIMHAYEHRYLLCPRHLVEQGDGFDVARYRIAKL